MVERRATGQELRADGRRLSGTVMRYGDVSPSHRERFEPGALRMAAAVPLNLFHDPERAVAWQPGGGLALRQDRDALTMTAELPPIPAADRALAMVREGQARGLSVEFRAVRERQDGGLRVIEEAVLSGIGIVRAPSYGGSRVEARARSGRTLRQRIPARKNLECRCSGASCKFARFVGEAMADMMDRAFENAVAGFGSYSDSPLASAARGTMRARILRSGDGELEIDLPESVTGTAVVAAHEAAPLVVRPHIDADAADSRIEGETRIYETAPVRGFVVSATDAREGWPEAELIATPADVMDTELASADAPRERRRRLWL